jgi:hypothetical protein
MDRLSNITLSVTAALIVIEATIVICPYSERIVRLRSMVAAP